MNIHELNAQLIVTSNDSLILFETNSGDSQTAKIPAPDLPPNLTKGQLEVLNKQDRTIVSVTTSRDGKFIAVATENKQLVVYDTHLVLKRNFIVNRTASKIVFTLSGDILVADRTGDVYLYKLDSENAEPTLLLGHLSMILDMVLSDCGKYIVTCDRDEKIRVSQFPNTYNIVSYCLGHEEFVTKIKVVGEILISASGDGTVRIWKYLKGEQINVINTNQYVGNANSLKQFVEKMDAENVEVNSLPITDVQIRHCNSFIIMAVSLFNHNSVQVYKLMLDTCHWNYLSSIGVSEVPFCFHLSSRLLIFDNFGVTVHQYAHDGFSRIEWPELADFYKKFKLCLKISGNNSITVLYKRKFDNVQEYLERKKQRLESCK